MAKLEKRGDDLFALTGEGAEITFNKESYEDLYFAVPPEEGNYMASGHFYRLWTDDIATDQTQRDAVNTILGDGEERETRLKSLQDQIKALAPA